MAPSHAVRCGSDHLATVGSCHAPFCKVERSVAWNIARETEVRKQEVLDRFFRVQGNNVENCWADQSDTTGEAQCEHIGVENETEYPPAER